MPQVEGVLVEIMSLIVRYLSFYSSSEEIVCAGGELVPIASRALQWYSEGLISDLSGGSLKGLSPLLVRLELCRGRIS